MRYTLFIFMNNNWEVISFIKKLFIAIIVLSIAVHFSWSYISSSLWLSANAWNSGNFENANITYLWNTAAALSLKLGWANYKQNAIIKPFGNSNISISEVLWNPDIGQEKLIAYNMTNITTYAAILQMDIKKLISESYNKKSALENHISLLNSYYTKTKEQLNILENQKNELKIILNNTSTDEKDAKNILQTSYKNLQYWGVDKAINNLLNAKNLNTRAKIYMIYLERFDKSYTALQNKNKKIIDALMINKEAIINQTIVTIPSWWTDLIKELWIIQSEAEYKTKQALE